MTKAKKQKPVEPEVVEKRGRGRPTKYRPEYCEMLKKHMSVGKAIYSFCAKIGINKETIREWVSKYPEFSVAKEQGLYLSFSWWEDVLIRAAAGLPITIYDKNGDPINIQKPTYNAALILYNVHNRFNDLTEWTHLKGKPTLPDKVDEPEYKGSNHMQLVQLVKKASKK